MMAIKKIKYDSKEYHKERVAFFSKMIKKLKKENAKLRKRKSKK